MFQKFMVSGAVALGLGMLLAFSSAAQEKEYITHKKCKMCHNKKGEGEQWNVWNKSKHRNAITQLESDNAKKYAAERGLTTPPNESPECLKCHVTGYDEATASFHPDLAPADSVQCESCHGPASLHREFGQIYMQKRGDVGDMATNILLPDAETCAKCHNDESPAWKPEKYTLEDGSKTGFDFDQAFPVIAHLNPKKEKNKDRLK